MGLDTVELVLAMEDTFEIAIPDEVAVNLLTPRDAINFIASRLDLNKQPQCLTQTAFYFLRRQLVEEEKMLSRRLFRPGADLRQLIPKKYHNMVWEKLSSRGELSLPDLSRPYWLIWTIWGLAIIILILSLFFLNTGVPFMNSGMSFINFILSLTLGFYVTGSYRSEIPRKYRQISRLVRALVFTNPRFFKNNGKKWSYDQIRNAVRCIVMETLATEEYNENWEFVKDFGAD